MNWPRFWLGLALTATAGAIDAISFARFGAVYASFMSGNTVQIGLHVAAADWAVLAVFLLLVAVFVVGGFVGGILVAKLGRWHLQVLLALEAAAIGLAAWLDLVHGHGLASTLPLSLAMGAQNQLVVLVRGANPATTFVTGTAFRLGDALAQRALGRDPHGAWRFHLAVWLSFAVGAGLGGLAQLGLQARALLPLAAVVTTLALVTIVAGLVRARDGEAADR